MISQVITFGFLYGQDSHYWDQQDGARAVGLGGAIVASWYDNSAIFYNPGANAFITDPSFSLSSDTYYYSNLQIDNGAGDDLDLQSSDFDIVPQIAAGVFKNYSKPKITFSLGYLNRYFSSINTSIQNEIIYPDPEDSIEPDIFIGTYAFKMRSREDWFGFGVAKKLPKNIGIGISLFGTYTTIDYMTLADANIYTYDTLNIIYITKEVTSSFLDIDFEHLGLLPKLGIAWSHEKYKFGVTLTFPRINIPIFSGSIIRIASATLPFEEYYAKISVHEDNIKTYYKSPWIIDIGSQRIFNKSKLMVRVAFFSKISRYALMDSIQTNTASSTLGRLSGYGIPSKAHKSVINAGFGYEQEIHQNIDLLLGFRTDFNYIDFNELNYQEDNLLSFSYWDLYHFSGGIAWKVDDFTLTIGFDYGLGRSKNDDQKINISDPGTGNFLFGEIQNNTSTRYNQFTLSLGVTYNFKKKAN